MARGSVLVKFLERGLRPSCGCAAAVDTVEPWPWTSSDRAVAESWPWLGPSPGRGGARAVESWLSRGPAVATA